MLWVGTGVRFRGRTFIIFIVQLCCNIIPFTVISILL